MGVTILVIDIVLEIGRPVNIFATNALRAAGDVNYPFYVGLVVMWSVAVGLGYLFGIPLGWGICGMWVAFCWTRIFAGLFCAPLVQHEMGKQEFYKIMLREERPVFFMGSKRGVYR